MKLRHEGKYIRFLAQGLINKGFSSIDSYREVAILRESDPEKYENGYFRWGSSRHQFKERKAHNYAKPAQSIKEILRGMF